MDNAKFLVGLAVVIAGMYLWYQRGLITRDHELCLDATQDLMEKQARGAGFEKVEQYEDYIDTYTSWYMYCRHGRNKQRNPEMYESYREGAERQDTE